MEALLQFSEAPDAAAWGGPEAAAAAAAAPPPAGAASPPSPQPQAGDAGGELAGWGDEGADGEGEGVAEGTRVR